MKKAILIIVVMVFAVVLLSGCELSTASSTSMDKQATIAIANNLSGNQPTPTDIDYSLERYNLIRRTYWVNGMREKAKTLPCPVKKPLGYIVLVLGDTVFGCHVVDGKVTSLNSYLTPDSMYYELSGGDHVAYNEWLSDIDGSYGENDDGIFFFTPNGNYIEWTGKYLYSDIPMEVTSPVIKYEVSENGQE